MHHEADEPEATPPRVEEEAPFLSAEEPKFEPDEDEKFTNDGDTEVGSDSGGGWPPLSFLGPPIPKMFHSGLVTR